MSGISEATEGYDAITVDDNYDAITVDDDQSVQSPAPSVPMPSLGVVPTLPACHAFMPPVLPCALLPHPAPMPPLLFLQIAGLSMAHSAMSAASHPHSYRRDTRVTGVKNQSVN